MRGGPVIPPSAASSTRRGFSLPSIVSDDAEQSSQSVNREEESLPSYRRVRRLEKFSRLPVWPVWNGVFIWMVEKLLGQPIAARLEDRITGRVCPNFFTYSETNPFVMLVHHCHSFSALDPLRWIQRAFFPEGFPAHPHRGTRV